MNLIHIVMLLVLFAAIVVDTRSNAFLLQVDKMSKQSRRVVRPLFQHAQPTVITMADATQRISKRALAAQIAMVALPSLAVCTVEPALSLM